MAKPSLNQNYPKTNQDDKRYENGLRFTMKCKPLTVIFLIIIINLTNFNLVDALKCYKCTMTKPSPHTNETVRLCAHFDYSDHYIVECPFSTMCSKKDISVNLTTPINGTERDCALQRYDYQDLEDGKWRLKVSIEEPYEERCSVIDDKGFRSSRTEYCYCRGDLCNSSPHSPTLSGISKITITTITIVFIFLNL